ncbi:MAG: hypothetical protein AMXMBFR84_00710 [Candidatus Hydrogenedentota bacterium]
MIALPSRITNAVPAKGEWPRILLLALLYLVFGRICFSLGTIHENISMVVYVPEGISLAFGILYGPRMAWGVLLGEFLLVQSSGGPLWFSLVLACSNAGENALGAWLLRRKGLHKGAIDATGVIWLALVSALLIQPMSATGGVLAKTIHEGLVWSDAGITWAYWWLANVLGQVLVTPFILAWVFPSDSMWSARSPWEKWGAIGGNALVLFTSVYWLPESMRNPIIMISLPYPTMTWGMLRLGLRGITIMNAMLVGTTVLSTAMGTGVFVNEDPLPQDFFFINVFMGCVVMSTMIVTTLFVERHDLVGALHRLVTIDSLTGAASRRHFFDRLGEEVSRSRRFGHPLCAIVFDIDHFKSVNDRYGHATGDEALKFVVRVALRSFRNVDHVGRIGGEEFAVLMPETGAISAYEAAERFRKAIAAEPIPDANGGQFTITISVGVAHLKESDVDPELLMQRADNALYVSKRNGRDCVSRG